MKHMIKGGNNRTLRPNKIIVVGGGVVETDGTKYYARSQLIEYLTGLRNFYKKVTWSVQLSNSRDYRTNIGESQLHLDIINKHGETLFTFRSLCGQLLHYWQFARRLDSATDIIVSNFSTTSIPYLLLSRIFGRKTLYYIGSDPKLLIKLRRGTLYGRFASLANCLVLPLSLILAHGILVRGRTTFDQCTRWNKNVVLSNPLISYKYFNDILSRKEENSKSDILNILYVGKLEENKGVHVLIKAMNSLIKKNISKSFFFKLNIVGSGVMKEELQNLVDKLGINSQVEFYGFIDDADLLANIYASNDIFVVPTVYAEGFPRVLDEAMTCGLPVICSRLGGMKDGLSEDEVFFVRPGDVEDLATAIKKIMDDTTLKRRLLTFSLARAWGILKHTAAEQHAMFLENLI